MSRTSSVLRPSIRVPESAASRTISFSRLLIARRGLRLASKRPSVSSSSVDHQRGPDVVDVTARRAALRSTLIFSWTAALKADRRTGLAHGVVEAVVSPLGCSTYSTGVQPVDLAQLFETPATIFLITLVGERDGCDGNLLAQLIEASPRPSSRRWPCRPRPGSSRTLPDLDVVGEGDVLAVDQAHADRTDRTLERAGSASAVAAAPAPLMASRSGSFIWS